MAAKAENEKAKISDYSVLHRPVITEKSAAMNGDNSIVFEVCRKASKDEIKAAIERVFNVKVTGVRTCNYLGKKKRTMRSSGRRVNYKKAYITLKEGQRIDVVEGL
jgi:large subunit ribosomal protein L23